MGDFVPTFEMTFDRSEPGVIVIRSVSRMPSAEMPELLAEQLPPEMHASGVRAAEATVRMLREQADALERYYALADPS